MTLDEWIEELRYGDLDSIKDRLDAIEILEFLEELKRLRSVIQMAKGMTEREQFYYGKGYADGRKELVQSVCDSLREELYGYNDCETDYYAGFDNGLKRAMRLMKAEVRKQDGRK